MAMIDWSYQALERTCIKNGWPNDARGPVTLHYACIHKLMDRSYYFLIINMIWNYYRTFSPAMLRRARLYIHRRLHE